MISTLYNDILPFFYKYNSVISGLEIRGCQEHRAPLNFPVDIKACSTIAAVSSVRIFHWSLYLPLSTPCIIAHAIQGTCEITVDENHVVGLSRYRIVKGLPRFLAHLF